MRISAFPKCYLDDISLHRTMTVFDWIEMSKELGADGLEMYVGFFPTLDDAYIDSVGEAIQAAGCAMPMMCCSPDFTQRDPAARQREIDKEAAMIRVTRRLGGSGAVCRILTGQRRPDVSIAEGVRWVAEAIDALLPVARENDIVLGLENHYKDGYWEYPEFAQKMAVFLQVLEAVPETPYFGVQYDPSNAIVAGDDPIALLERVAPRVVSMHASDRYLVPGATLSDLVRSDGTIGYSPSLLHGVTGKGLNDYDRIMTILAGVGYDGWISIEDGMNGMGEMKESIDFLKRMRARYFDK